MATVAHGCQAVGRLDNRPETWPCSFNLTPGLSPLPSPPTPTTFLCLLRKIFQMQREENNCFWTLSGKVFREFVFATVHLFSAEQLPKAWLRCMAWSVASILQLSRKTMLGQPVSVYEWEEIFKQFASNVPISWLLLRKVAFHFFVFSGKTLVWAQQWGRRWRLTWTRWGGWVGET